MSEKREMEVYQPPAPVVDADVVVIGRMMAQSGYFQDAKQEAQAVVKVLAGREMGFPAVASMTGIWIIQGRVTIGANMMAGAVKRSRRYDYKVTKINDEGCWIDFYEGGVKLGESSFTRAQAVAAKTQNIDKFPRNMFFARAMSNGVKWFCPDIFLGAPVYTPDELGAAVTYDDGGNILSVNETPSLPQAASAPQKAVVHTAPEAPAAPALPDLARASSGIRSAMEKRGFTETHISWLLSEILADETLIDAAKYDALLARHKDIISNRLTVAALDTEMAFVPEDDPPAAKPAAADDFSDPFSEDAPDTSGAYPADATVTDVMTPAQRRMIGALQEQVGETTAIDGFTRQQASQLIDDLKARIGAAPVEKK